MKKICLCLTWLFVCVAAGYAQDAPFYKDIQQFKTMDRETPPPPAPVLFIGSSSFTKWTDVQDYFPGYTIVNRGFGGSRLNNLLYYFNDLVPVYRPKQIVIYCGENDLANDATPADTAVERFKKLYTMIREYDEKVEVDYVSMKPSPSREKYFDKFKAANSAIEQFLKGKPNSHFINVYDAMLDKNGKPMNAIFVEDMLHMNAGGYHIWQKIIKPYLKK